jgi:hypothetical protein
LQETVEFKRAGEAHAPDEEREEQGHGRWAQIGTLLLVVFATAPVVTTATVFPLVRAAAVFSTTSTTVAAAAAASWRRAAASWGARVWAKVAAVVAASVESDAGDGESLGANVHGPDC